MKQVFLIFFLVGIPVLFSGGCGGSKKPDGLPDLHPCEVRISMNGSPLADADVSLIGADGRWPAGGRTDATGTAKIATRGYPGAAEGDYKVTVGKMSVPPSMGGDVASTEEPKPMIHEIYSNSGTTKLQCTVKPGPNSFDFTVEVP